MPLNPDPIKHVVLLMMENHSFDEMLGCYQEKYPDLDGVLFSSPPRSNTDDKGNHYYQLQKSAYCMRCDPKHELANVAKQLENNNGGFIKNFVTNYPSSTTQDRDNLMGYYRHGFLPALHALADDFTICDHWFSSLPGPTWPNRFFALSGTSSGRTEMPEGMQQPHLDTIRDQTQDTIFDKLNEKGRTWKIYYYDFPCSLIFEKLRQPHNLMNYHSIDEFFNTDSRTPESEFPDFVFIEPKYFGVDQNDDHPPHNIMKAEKLIADVYNAIRSNAELWNSTLLIVAFDEHGGFYDHVTPPPTIAPDDKNAEYDFKQLGIRVPALLISPWTARGVEHMQFDHTSVLKYLAEKWGLGALGARTAQAKSIGVAINQKVPRTDTIGFIRVPFSELVKNDGNANDNLATGHHNAIHVLAEYLESEMKDVESPLLSKATSLAEHTAVIAMQTKNASVNTLASIGRGVQWLGNKIAAAGINAQAKRIQKTTSAADDIIQIGRQTGT